MQIAISNPKDFWTGLVYIAIGAAALLLGSDYAAGTAIRMGPGYFPRVLAGCLVVLVLVSLVRAFLTKGEPVGAIAWKPLVLVLLGVALFAVLVNGAGLVVALLALALTSAAASREFRFDAKASLGLAGLIAFCVLVFVRGLGLPFPIVGAWLAPWVEPLLSQWR